MKTITKNTKRVLSLLIALAILLGSLVVLGNIGVSLKASAETTTVKVYGGTPATSFSDKSAGTQDDPIIIYTPEELAFLVKGAGGTNASDNKSNGTTGVYYKVDDNLIFDMNGMNGITLESTLTDVTNNSSLTGKNWNGMGGWSHATKFMGNFDGNGLIVYNLYGTNSYMGLFPLVDGGATIKNVTVKNSKFISSGSGAGGIFGAHLNYVSDMVTIENCAVVNCYIEDTTTGGKVGLIGGTKAYQNVSISNTFTKNNNLKAKSGTTASYGGFIGNSSDGGTMLVSKSIAIGNSPYCVTSAFPRTPSYSDVYTDTDSRGFAGITVGIPTGAEAVSTIGFSSNIWMATTNSYPELKIAHNLTLTNNNDSTHSAVCTLCGTVGAPESHFYYIEDVEHNTLLCDCGAEYYGIPTVWDGTADYNWEGAGTKDDPYIIKTAEQLYAMVQSEGYKTENGEDIPLYFRVADGVDTLYLNNTVNCKTAQDFANSVSTARNWSKDLVVASDSTCQDPDCPAKTNGHTDESGSSNHDLHYGAYIYTFLGHFDGNGVTIEGLYSKTDAANDGTGIYPGTGFFPGMSDNASIANVTFDLSYIENKGGNAAVVTSSFGTAASNNYFYSSSARCTYFTTRYAEHDDKTGRVGASITLSNIAVKRAYITTTFKSKWAANQNVGGLLATQFSADSVAISNCLFDATTSVMQVNGSSTPLKAGIFASTTYINDGNSLYNCLTLSNENIDNIASNYETQYNISTNCYAQGSGSDVHGTIWTNDLTPNGMPMFDWATWDEDTLMPSASEDGLVFKNYRFYKDNFINSEHYDGNAVGSYSDGLSDAGLFMKLNTLKGDGTPSHPYLISTADELFQIIAAGGKYREKPMYYRLISDIDVGGTQWVRNKQLAEDVNTTYNVVYYDYRPFEGTLDGNGHTITGLYSATDDTAAGLIPELDGGTVKNLHIRNGYVYSTAANAQVGLIAGSVTNGGKIINCSIDDSASPIFASTSNTEGTGTDWSGNINYQLHPTTMSDELMSTEGNDKIYYGVVGEHAHMLSRAKKMPCVDVDGDGYGSTYSAADLTALKNRLLGEENYQYVYSDVSKNGKTDMRDLAYLKREMIDDEWTQYDGFWRMIKSGNVHIYFTDSDDYDAARKLEVFFESQLPGLDIEKYIVGDSMAGVANAATVPTSGAIVITSGSATTGNYTINVDNVNILLTIHGDNYTAAYEATNAFIAGSSAETGEYVGSNGQTVTGSIDENYNSIKVGGNDYYYSWGEEFNEDVDGSINYDTWLIRDKGGDTEVSIASGTTSSSYAFYDNLKLGSDEMLPILNEVKNGKLYMHRGVSGYDRWNDEFAGYSTNADVLADDKLETYMSNTLDDNGNKVQFDKNDMASGGILSTKNSMIYNKGYVEFKVILPNDKHSFPALWLYTTPGYNNRDIDLGMHSRVLPLNDRYDGTSQNFTAERVSSYKYQVPTYYYEIDVVEILNQGDVRKNTQTTLHKWYTTSRVTIGDANDKKNYKFNLFDLDWSYVSGANNTAEFTDKSAIATYNGGSISGLNLHKDSKNSHSTFSSSTYQGGASMIFENNTYVGSLTQTKELIYGYLWEDGNMTVYILDGDESSSNYRKQLKTWNVNDQLTKGGGDYDDYDGYSGTTVADDQYAYVLIDNHMFPYNSLGDLEAFLGGGSFSSLMVHKDYPMELDYVRVYQLNDAKNVVTSYTEAFNSNNRLG